MQIRNPFAQLNTLLDKYWIFDLFLLSLILCITIISAQKFIYSFLGFDEGVFVWAGHNILQGEIPYRDFLEIKPVTIFFMNALGLIIFGLDNFKIMPLLVVIASIILFYLSLTRFGIKKILTFIITLHYSALMFYMGFHHTLNDVETYGLSFAIIGLSLILWNLSNKKTLRSDPAKFLSGVFLGFSVLSKEPFIFSTLSIIISTFLFQHINRQQHRFRHLFLTIMGGLSVVAILFTYLYHYQALNDYLNTLGVSFLHSRIYSSQPTTFRYAVSKLTDLYYNLERLSVLIPFYLFFLFKYRLGLFSIINILGIFLGAYGISIGHSYWSHNYYIGTIGLLLPAIYGAHYLSKTYHHFHLIPKLLVVLFIILSTTPSVAETSRNIIIDLILRSYEPAVYLPKKETIESINRYSSKGDYILLKDNAFLYAAFERKHPLKWSTMLDSLMIHYEGQTESEKISKINAEIESKLPRIIYLPPTQIALDQAWHTTNIINPLIKKYNYQLVETDMYVLPNIDVK